MYKEIFNLHLRTCHSGNHIIDLFVQEKGCRAVCGAVVSMCPLLCGGGHFCVPCLVGVNCLSSPVWCG